MKYTLNIFCNCKIPALLGLFVLTSFFLIAGCAAPSKPLGMTPTAAEHSHITKQNSTEAGIENRLRQEYRRWKGTRHRLGGTGSRGIDCSGFVQAVYKDVFNLDLPRSTKAQVRQGRAIPFKKLRAGDLVFFKPPTYPRHVGIYLSGSEFMHASKTKGVILSKIDRIYWGNYYWTARRILPTGEPH